MVYERPLGDHTLPDEGGWFDMEQFGPVHKDVGKMCALGKLTSSIRSGNLPILLCGPPGVGKKGLFINAANATDCKFEIYDIACITEEIKYKDKASGNWRSTDKLHISEDHLMKVMEFVNKIDIFTNKEKLLGLYCSELLDDRTAAYVRKYPVVLIASERTRTLNTIFGNRTQWVNRLTRGEMIHYLKTLQATP